MDSERFADFSVGEVLGASFRTLFKNIIPFGVLGTLIYAPFYLVLFIFYGTVDFANALVGGMSAWAIGLAYLAFFILTYLIYGAVTYGTVRSLQGRPASIGEVLVRGLSTVLPVLGVAFLAGLAFFIGFLLLVVPGIMVFVAVWVAIPVAVVERPGVINSLKRSVELTRGYRWSILGLVVIAGIIGGILGGVASAVLDPTVPLEAIILGIIQGIGGAFGAVVVAVGYQQLRQAKEGIDVNQLAAVFS